MATSKACGIRLTAAERKKEIVRLRRNGFTLAKIAEQVGCSAQYAHKILTTYLERLETEFRNDVRELRQLEAERLDRAQLAVWDKAVKGDVGAIDRVLRIMERRARLFGLDAPARQEITGKDGRPFSGGGGLASLLTETEGANND